jgi:acetoin utilization protein AcuB
MLVQHIMQSPPLSVTPATTLHEVRQLMRRRGIRHVLVVEGGRLAGIVSDRDLKNASAQGRADEIMTRELITVAPDAPVEEAGRLMVREKISALPVTLGGRLVGIVTETDVLRLFVTALGATEPSSRLDVRLGAERTALAEVVRLVESTGVRPTSVLTLTAPDGGREVVLRIPTIDPGPVVRALAADGYSVETPWRERSDSA